MDEWWMWMDVAYGWMNRDHFFPIGFQSTSMISSVLFFLLPTTNNPLALTLCTDQSVCILLTYLPIYYCTLFTSI
jgi:hypothetical protein